MSRSSRRLAAGAWTLVVLVACSLPASNLPETDVAFPVDKVAHFTLFLVFGLAWRWAGVAPGRVLLLGAAFALVLEPYQGLVAPGRSPELYDAVMNLAGLGAALLITTALGRHLVRKQDVTAP